MEESTINKSVDGQVPDDSGAGQISGLTNAPDGNVETPDATCPKAQRERATLNDPPNFATATPDPIDPLGDLTQLRLDQSFTNQVTGKTVLTTIAVRKPNRHEFVRVRPGDEWKFETATLVDGESREVYLVDRNLWVALSPELQPTALVLAMSRVSPVPFLWPCRLPGADGRPNRWHESALEAVKIAEQQWCKVVADMAAGCYVPSVAVGDLPEPVWPELLLAELLKLAFKDRFIRDVNHPVLRRLRGEI